MSTESAKSPGLRPADPPPARRRDGVVVLVALVSGIAAMADLELARFVAVIGSMSVAIGLIRTRIATRSSSADRPDATDAATGPATREIEERALFLAMASHEIRTPLVGILGMADLLAATPLSGEQTAYVRAVRASGLSLIGLVDGYLQMTSRDAGHGTLTPAPTALETIVEDVIELLAPAAEAKGLELASCVAPGLPARVMVDPVLLRQILTNLAGNAVKYTEHGGVAIEVERGRSGILFRVRDTGIGIDPADAERIFGEFERAAPAGSDAPEGTGLGLAIARATVARMGGEIRLDSRPGAGSTFSFEIALPPVDGPPVEAATLVGLRVALVSDGVVEPPLLLRRLHAHGAEALGFPVPEGLGDAPPLDVLLIDHRSDHDAGAVLERLRALRVDLPPLICLLSPTLRGDLPRLRAAGFTGHLVKPVRSASLVRVVAALAEPGAPPMEEAEPAPGEDDEGLRVLLVDDNEINALLGRAVLEHLGHRVASAPDGTAALEALTAARDAGRPFDAVLMDLHMPGLDGFATIRALRADEPDDATAALVIALTADGTPAAADRALASGADACMVKPIDRNRLADLLAAPRGPARAPATELGPARAAAEA